jgi:excisionase family DNA binding protein
MSIDEKHYTRKEVARILSVHHMTIYREIQRGKLKAVKVGNDYRIPESSIVEYLKNQQVKINKK